MHLVQMLFNFGYVWNVIATWLQLAAYTVANWYQLTITHTFWSERSDTSPVNTCLD